MSSTKEFNMNVKYTAYALIAFILIIIAELGSFLVISFYKDNYAINIDSELLVAIEKMNHVRHFELGRNYESLTSLIYSRNLLSLPEKEEKKPQIFIQGDSWAEQLLYAKSPRYKTKLHQIEDYMDVIYAGISSFSPSLMTAQFEWLRDNLYDFAPEVVVAIVDQTDFGDELCRYKDVRSVNANGSVTVAAFDPIKSNQAVYQVKRSLIYSTILNSDSLNLIKAFKLAFYRIKAHLAPKEKHCGWSEISRPLYQGLGHEEASYVISVFSDYLNSIEKMKTVHTVIFVTHPHYKHLSKEYILEMGEFIDNNMYTIKENVALNVVSLRIQPPVVTDGSINKNFKLDDLASHLTDKAHSSYYIRAIAEEVRSHIN